MSEASPFWSLEHGPLEEPLDPEDRAAWEQDPTMNVGAHEADLEEFVREYNRREQGTSDA